MKGLVICMKGIEETVKQEIDELIKAKSDIHPTALVFPIKKKQDLAKLCYKSQSAIKVLYLFDKIKVDKNLEKSLNNIEKSIKKTDFSDWLKDRTFKVLCKRIGEHDYSGQDISVKAGEYIINKTNAKVSMTDPDIVFYIYIYEKDCYLGIDCSGFDLSKRDYRVFVHPNSLNATIAYSLIRKGGFNKGRLLDPFCGSGVIPIEAALYLNNISPHFYKKDKFSFHRFIDIDLEKFDKKKKSNSKIKASDHILKFVKSTKNNAKLAGVDKIIDVTRMDIEWLDTKLDEHSVDIIVTHPPSETRFHDKKQIKKLFKELFYQSEYVLKKNGKIVLCLQRDEVLKDSLGNYRITDTFSIFQGKQELKCLTIE